MHEVFIVAGARTAIGAFQGVFRDQTAPKLGSRALAGAIERAGITPADLQQVYMGCVLPAGVGQAPARQATLGAGCPPATGAITFNKVCGSAMQATMSAANDLRCGDFSLVAAGGMESMSQAPYLAVGVRDGLRLGAGKLVDSLVHDGLWDPYGDKHMGSCAESCAREYGISREAQDVYSRESYARARAAQESGLFAAEIVPVRDRVAQGNDDRRQRRGTREVRPREDGGAPAGVREGRNGDRRQRQQDQRRRRRAGAGDRRRGRTARTAAARASRLPGLARAAARVVSRPLPCRRSARLSIAPS